MLSGGGVGGHGDEGVVMIDDDRIDGVWWWGGVEGEGGGCQSSLAVDAGVSEDGVVQR